MGYSPIASPVQYSDGKWAAVGSEGRRNPWVLTTQQGYQETWKNKIQTTVNLEQDLKFITKGLKFYGRFGSIHIRITVTTVSNGRKVG